MSNNNDDHPPQRHFEYVDKGSWWPQWGSLVDGFNLLPPSLSSSTPQSTQGPISYVVVRNTTNLPVNTLMSVIEQYTNTWAQQSSQSPSQTIVVILSGNSTGVDTNAILNRLFMSHQPQTTPASQSFIDSLQQITITQDTLIKQHQCSICMEDFHVDEQASELPCHHCFHQQCIKPWLSAQHTCPVCRHSLPTESTATRIFTFLFLFLLFLFIFLSFFFSSKIQLLFDLEKNPNLPPPHYRQIHKYIQLPLLRSLFMPSLPLPIL